MDLKFLNKKVSLGVFIASLFGASALVYSLGYKIAMDKFNDVVSYVQEKQKIYSTLSELDHNIRSDYISDIPESDISTAVCRGYVNGLDDESCSFWDKKGYRDYQEEFKKVQPSIEHKKLNDNVVYLKCDKLVNNASKDVIDKIDGTFVSGINNIIFDLRDCNESSDEEVFKILQHIIPSGDIVSAVNNKNESEVVCKSTSSGVDLNFVVLVNEKTRGGAEILASALKDSKNAKIVGVKTAGKPVRTKKITLADDSVVIFTDAYYVTNSGNSIYKKGLKPDVTAENAGDVDNQLNQAIELLGKK